MIEAIPFSAFPHHCPGDGCAICAWTARHKTAPPLRSIPHGAPTEEGWPLDELIARELEKQGRL